MKATGLLITVILLCSIAGAQEETEESVTDLAKKAQNPLEDMASLPLQYNAYFETGPKAKTQTIINIQPVIPFNLNDDWLFVARPLISLMELPPLTDGQNRNHGLANFQFQGFFSPKETASDWIVGFGPYLEFPTNSGPDGRFGSDNWSAGPAFVALKFDGPWVYGGLFTQLWSYYGNDPEVNTGAIQPFVYYNMEDGWYVFTEPVLTVDWSEGDSDNRWTIPLGGGIGKMSNMGKRPVNTSLGVYYNVESPRSGSDWQLQFQIQFLF
ncbi:MAG: neuromedin U [Planctomycetota bacterium]